MWRSTSPSGVNPAAIKQSWHRFCRDGFISDQSIFCTDTEDMHDDFSPVL
jgi:hypothetical protein